MRAEVKELFSLVRDENIKKLCNDVDGGYAISSKISFKIGKNF
ncbi:hypothetical protein [Candidatus Ornithobacterium hominis]|nr:hypothetical protein [Candidatus Ornithobacterium hominis]